MSELKYGRFAAYAAGFAMLSLATLRLAACRGVESSLGENRALSTGCPGELLDLNLKSGPTATLNESKDVQIPEQVKVSAYSAAQASGRVRIAFELPLDNKKQLTCTYAYSASGVYRLERCERGLDATSLVHTSSVTISGQELAATADVAVSLCAVPNRKPAFSLPDEQQGIPTSQFPAVPAEMAFDSAALTYPMMKGWMRRASVDARVRPLLGERWAFCYRQSIDQDKNAVDDKLMQLIFYSYSTKKVLAVTSNHGAVTSVAEAKVWPMECEGEIEEGIQLARKDARLAGRVNLMRGAGMLYQHLDKTTFPQDHRIMDINFETEDWITQYRAIVDLTDRRILRVSDIRQ